ncbi:MAG: nucleoside hydrolase [Candidatus Cryptobacteroides sp.]
MKQIIISLLVMLISALAFAQPQGNRNIDRRTKVIVVNDLCGDADGLFATAHQLLCKSINVRGIIGTHLSPRGGFTNASNTAQASVDKANELLDIMGMSGKVKVATGACEKMMAPGKPQDSEGARLIIDEALQCSPEHPLYVLVGGPLTDIASALLINPEISKNIIIVWIGGQEYDFGHQKPWGGISDVEYNLNLSIAAGQMIFNDSDVRLWQVPRDAYRRCLYGMDEIKLKITPYGRLGEYLDASLGGVKRFAAKEEYVLGDSPLVLLSSLQTFFEPDTASSDFVEVNAPYITDEGLYDFSRPGRKIRVYTTLDTSLMFRDMETKIQLLAR